MDDTYKKRVWEGDASTVLEAQTRYFQNPEKELINYAVALYSFRYRREYADDLVGLVGELILEAERFMTQPITVEPERLEKLIPEGDKADVLSTHLLWIVEHGRFSMRQKADIYDLVRKVCTRGCDVLGIHYDRTGGKPGGHSYHLLRLTLAEVILRNGGEAANREALIILNRVERSAEKISDPKQKARVFRRLGMLYRKVGKLKQGVEWGVRACAVPGVPLAVQLKSVSALLGIER